MKINNNLKKILLIAFLIFLFTVIINYKSMADVNLKTKGFHYIGEMNAKRAYHNSKKLDDGRILITGGYNKIAEYSNYKKPPSIKKDYTPEPSQEIFNPKNNTFNKTEEKFNYNSDRLFHSYAEVPKILEYFKTKDIEANIYRDTKLDDERILILAAKRRFSPNYPDFTTKHAVIFNKKTNKYSPIINFDKEMINLIVYPINNNNDDKAVFIYSYNPKESSISKKRTYNFQISIFNFKTNKIEKEIYTKNIDKINEYRIFKLKTGNIFILENDKIKYLFDIKTNELKEAVNADFKINTGANIIQINDNQLLITGGYDERKTKIYRGSTKKEGNCYLDNEKEISKSAYIFTF